jgi:hypothetical protein
MNRDLEAAAQTAISLLPKAQKIIEGYSSIMM